MPYIVRKRSDIPRGALQILDLVPNESLRVPSLDPPGQNKYINPIVNDRVVLTGAGPIRSYVTSYGLASWIVTNINDGTGAIATGSFTIAAGNANPGDSASIDTSALGGPNVTFNFVAIVALPTDVLVGGTEDETATNFAAAISNPVNGLVPYITAVAVGGGPPSLVDLTAAQVGTSGNSIAIAVVGANLAVSGATLAGGVDANGLTATQANTIADTILSDLIRYGDLTQPAVDADLVTVNNLIQAIVPTAIGALDTQAQLQEIFDILTGRTYILPKGVQIDLDGSTFQVDPPVGSANGPRFVDPSFVQTYDTGAFKISFGEGQMFGFRQESFVYQDVPGNPNGEAIAVYNDDGTLYTV